MEASIAEEPSKNSPSSVGPSPTLGTAPESLCPSESKHLWKTHPEHHLVHRTEVWPELPTKLRLEGKRAQKEGTGENEINSSVCGKKT